MSDRAVVEAYLSLVEEFLAGDIDARTFERRYLEAWSSAPPHGPGPLFDVLEGLFLDVDAYCADPELRDEGDLDDDALRLSAQKARRRLSELMRPQR